MTFTHQSWKSKAFELQCVPMGEFLQKKSEQGGIPALNCPGCKYLITQTLGELSPNLDPLMEAKLYSCRNPQIIDEDKDPTKACVWFEASAQTPDLGAEKLKSYLEEGEEFITNAVDEDSSLGRALKSKHDKFLSAQKLMDTYLENKTLTKYESIRIFVPAFDVNGNQIEGMFSVVGKRRKLN